MSRAVLGACVVFLAGSALPGASPASAGDWRHHHAVEVVRYGHVHRAPWYHQPPLLGTGPGYYYSHYPDHIPAYPKLLTGYPVPIYETSRPVVPVVPRYRVVITTHVAWCAARYRSYDLRTDTWQPYRGPRRHCGSPFR